MTPYYDSLLAKVTAWGRTREGARERMKRALAEFRVVGVATNIPYLQEILDMPDFITGNLDTGFLDRHSVQALEPLEQHREAAQIAALLIVDGGLETSRATTRRPRMVISQRSAVHGPSAWRERMTGVAQSRGKADDGPTSSL